MKRPYHNKSVIQLVGAVAIGLGASLVAPTASAQLTAQEAQERYARDVEYCNSGQSSQDRQTCLREAGAALQEARRNRLLVPDVNYTSNQQARCDHLSGTAREDCLTLMSDTNPQMQGSVEGGGILRQTTITIPGEAPRM